ncbi:unnamed protein product, partial [Hapterophycus canaliculatus]
HRRLGHPNPPSMDVLRKTDGNGVTFTDVLSACDMCALTKSRQQAHPKTNPRKTQGPMKQVYNDLMGPLSPPAKCSPKYISKFTVDFSRMKEDYLLRSKSKAAQSLHAYNATVAATLDLRIQNVRRDKGTEYTSNEFKTLCLDGGINIEYTATNAPQQNGVSECDGQTPAKIV